MAKIIYSGCLGVALGIADIYHVTTNLWVLAALALALAIVHSSLYVPR